MFYLNQQSHTFKKKQNDYYNSNKPFMSTINDKS